MFTQNGAAVVGGAPGGGAIHFNNDRGDCINQVSCCTFDRNNNAMAFRSENGANGFNASTTVTNCIFAGNTASGKETSLWRVVT